MNDANPSIPQPESMDAATQTLQAAIAGYITAAVSQGVSPINTPPRHPAGAFYLARRRNPASRNRRAQAVTAG